jgi:threonyl-tRNA synthetase
MKSNPALWAKAGVIVAINAWEAGLKPVNVGLGERDFYVDLDSNRSLTPAELERLERYSKYDYELEENVVRYKTVTFHVEQAPSQSEPKHIKLLNVSVHHPTPERQLLRLSGVGFETETDLMEYMRWLDEAQQTDHRIIGQRMDLFSFHEEVGPGLVLYHPNGQIIRKELMKYMDEVNASMGYREVFTPHLFRTLMWQISGHYTLYRDKMVSFTKDDEEYGVKPMNCPGAIMIYSSRPRSYRELPIRFSEYGQVYRWEKRGELYGVLRPRGFMIDDGHVFLAESQIEDEIRILVSTVLEVYTKMGFSKEDIKINLSTRPDESIGTEEQWKKASDGLVTALENLGLDFAVKDKEGTFYGPKIDFDVRDSLGRWWQLPTIQLDFNLPERFKLDYVGKDGTTQRPVMIHRAIYGSYERFLSVLLEHHRGKLPTWLCPVQVRIVPISDSVEDYAQTVHQALLRSGVRAEVVSDSDTLSKRIKKAYGEGIPYIMILGEKEKETQTVGIRGRENFRQDGVRLEVFLAQLTSEIKNRELHV